MKQVQIIIFLFAFIGLNAQTLIPTGLKVSQTSQSDNTNYSGTYKVDSKYLLVFQLKYVEKTEIKDKEKEWFTFEYGGYSKPINYDPQTKIFNTKEELETFINSNVMDVFGVYEVFRKLEIINETKLFKIKTPKQ